MSESGERRMLFDIRGRRKHVVRVVYAILALLMGASLFLLAGPVGIGGLFESDSSTSASAVFDEQAEKIEGKLVATPDDEGLLLALTRARVNAGNSLAEADPATGQTVFPPEAGAEFEQAGEAWNRYLKQADSPNPAAAQLVAGMYFSLAEASPGFEEAVAALSGAAKAQQIAADAKPSVSTLTSLSFYKYFAGDFPNGDRARRQALTFLPTIKEKETVAAQLAGYRRNAKKFDEQKQEFTKAQQSKSKEALENPLGGLSGGSPLGE